MSRASTLSVSTVDSLLDLGLGLLAGGMGAFFGIGGGVVLVPALTLVVGLELRAAVGISLVSVIAMSVASSVVHIRAGRADLPVGGRLMMFAVLGSVPAGLIAPAIPQAPLFLLFAVLLVFAAWRMLPGRPPTRREDRNVLLRTTRARTNAAYACSVGAGVMSGLLGVGGGVINTPVIHLLLGRNVQVSIATSSFMIGGTGLAALAPYALRGDVDYSTAGLVAIGTVVGSAAIASVAHRVHARVVKTLLVVLLLLIAARMTVRAFGL